MEGERERGRGVEEEGEGEEGREKGGEGGKEGIEQWGMRLHSDTDIDTQGRTRRVHQPLCIGDFNVLCIEVTNGLGVLLLKLLHFLLHGVQARLQIHSTKQRKHNKSTATAPECA